jgi:hypothetical protein
MTDKGMTHGLTIIYSGSNPDVLLWLQRIRAQASHPQYQGDIVVGTPFLLSDPAED